MDDIALSLYSDTIEVEKVINTLGINVTGDEEYISEKISVPLKKWLFNQEDSSAYRDFTFV